MAKSKLNPELLEKVEPALIRDEQILWLTKPDTWSVFIKGTSAYRLFVIILSIFLFGFIAIFNSTIGINISTITLIAICGVLILVGVLVWEYIMAGDTIYAITNFRVLIIRGDDVQSYTDEDMQFLRRKNGSNGKGDIIFRYDYVERRSRRHRHYTEKITVGFFGVNNVRRVEALMLKVFNFDDDSKMF